MAGEAPSGEVIDIPLSRLVFDPENPRLPRSVDANDEGSVLDYMLRDATLTDLMASIGEDGYFPGEPILVAPLEGETLDVEDGQLRVVEGNRRLASVKLLNEPSLAPSRVRTVATIVDQAKYFPKLLPVIAFDDRSEILDYLGYRHITGVDAWDSLAKARYLKQLLGEPPKSPAALQARLQVLAKKIGSYNRTDYVRKLLSGLSLYEDAEARGFYDLSGVDEDTLEFSLLTTAIGYTNIRTFLKVPEGELILASNFDRRRAKKLFGWLFEVGPDGSTILGESRQLRELSAVVASPRALRILNSGKSLAEARLETDEPLTVFQNSVETAKSRVDVAISNATIVSEFTPADDESVSELRLAAKTLQDIVRGRIREQDDE